MRARSRRSRRRSSPAPGCPRWRARRRAALGASVALIDRSSAVLAVAASSSAEESKLLAGEGDVETLELRVADAVGRRAALPRAASGDPSATLIADGLDAAGARARALAGAGVGERRGGGGVRARGARRARSPTAATSSPAAAELGASVEAGAGVIFARAAPRAAQTGDWRARVLVVSLRALRAASAGRDRRARRARRARPRCARSCRSAEPAQLERATAALGARARRVAAGLSRHRRAQPLGRRPGRPLPRRPGGAAGGQRRRGRRARAARVRGHGLLPAAAAGDERGPGRARSASTRRRSRRCRPTTSSTRPTS